MTAKQLFAAMDNAPSASAARDIWLNHMFEGRDPRKDKLSARFAKSLCEASFNHGVQQTEIRWANRISKPK